MNKQILFDEVAEAEPVEGPTLRVASTEATRERYAVLKSKRKGQTWEEDGRIYRVGSCGVTVFKWF